jgi:hypothetical protein
LEREGWTYVKTIQNYHKKLMFSSIRIVGSIIQQMSAFMESNRSVEFAGDMENQLRIIHPTALIMKPLHEEYHNYRLPDGNSCWEPDDDDGWKIKRFSSPSIRYVTSFKYGKGPCLFDEWLLHFLPNQQELWDEYRFW